MTITNHPVCGFNLHSTDASPGASPRSSGIHLSGILRKMALQYGKLPAEYANSNAGQLIRETPIELAGNVGGLCRMAFGMAWENWIVAHVGRFWPDFTHQPGEFIRDDIRGTPDGLSQEPDGNPALHEFKFTWKSMNKPIADEWLWLAQVSGYAALVSHYLCCPVTKAYLHVAYAMGDYSRDKPESGPKYRVYAIEMSQEEVERAWGEFVKNKEMAEPEEWEA
jgi:hypothetical protein